MVTCDTAIEKLKDEIIKKVTEKDVMKKLDKKKIPFEISAKKIQTKIKDIEKKDFLSALKQFMKIRKKSKGGRSRKGGHWLSWVVYILCRVTEEYEGETLGINPAITYIFSECDDDFAEMEASFNTDSASPAASSPAASSPAASSSAASAPSAAASPSAAAVTYTPYSIGRMTMVDRQSIPPEIVDSWNYDDRYEAYTGPVLGGGGKKTYRKRKTKKRKKSRKRKSRKKRRKRKTKRKRSSRKRR